MADYSNNSRPNPNGVFPENAIDGQEWSRVQPVISVEKLKQMYLLGIDLVAPLKNRVTGQFDRMTDETVQEHILDAIAALELDFGIDIFPAQRSERMPYDQNFMLQFGYFRVEHKPVLSVDQIALTPNGNDVGWIVPKEWIQDGMFSRGQINIWASGPSVYSAGLNSSSSTGALLIDIIRRQPFTPQSWKVTYTAGFPGGMVPRVVNQAIGCKAAIDICNALAAMYQVSSYSLGIDGMSQSQSNPGPQRFQLKIAELEKRLDAIRGKLKMMFGTKWAMSTI
jgi:hypothetical protein